MRKLIFIMLIVLSLSFVSAAWKLTSIDRGEEMPASEIVVSRNGFIDGWDDGCSETYNHLHKPETLESLELCLKIKNVAEVNDEIRKSCNDLLEETKNQFNEYCRGWDDYTVSYNTLNFQSIQKKGDSLTGAFSSDDDLDADLNEEMAISLSVANSKGKKMSASNFGNTPGTELAERIEDNHPLVAKVTGSDQAKSKAYESKEGIDTFIHDAHRIAKNTAQSIKTEDGRIKSDAMGKRGTTLFFNYNENDCHEIKVIEGVYEYNGYDINENNQLDSCKGTSLKSEPLSFKTDEALFFVQVEAFDLHPNDPVARENHINNFRNDVDSGETKYEFEDKKQFLQESNLIIDQALLGAVVANDDLIDAGKTNNDSDSNQTDSFTIFSLVAIVAFIYFLRKD